MERIKGLRGRGGRALGLAVIVKAGADGPALSSIIADHIASEAKKGSVERLDIVLVAQKIDDLSGVVIPYTRITGIVSEQESDDEFYMNVATVTGAVGIMELTSGGSLVLVDANNGIVLVDPDGQSVAGYQVEEERRSPRTRFHLEFEHQPARTADGRVIHVIAGICDEQSAAGASQLGMDAIYVMPRRVNGQKQGDFQEELRILGILAESAVSKPVMVYADAVTDHIPALLRLARVIDLILILPFELGKEGMHRTLAHLDGEMEEQSVEASACGPIALCTVVELGQSGIAEITDMPISRLIVEFPPVEKTFPSDAERWLSETFIQASLSQIPLLVSMPGHNEEGIGKSVGIGASGIITTPELVQRTKILLQTLNYAELKEKYYSVG